MAKITWSKESMKRGILGVSGVVEMAHGSRHDGLARADAEVLPSD
jgi:hypothetical protein